jgi:Mlc titration factor MtfA (ptsG expression regulator)
MPSGPDGVATVEGRGMIFGWMRRRRRARISAIPLPDAWWTIIDRRVPAVRTLDARDRAELAGHVQILLAEKRFEGCGGLEMTDEIRVTIAAQAAMLLLHRETDYYPTLRSILVYPHAYVVEGTRHNPDGTITEGPQIRLGESWYRGSLVLSWDDVVRGAADDDDGHNVVFHEFAHQLDGESGAMNGAPAMPASRTGAWARVLSREYTQLTEELHRGHRTLLDPYAATNPPEFFAVATEFFMERPRTMRAQLPELYHELARFYSRDPAADGDCRHGAGADAAPHLVFGAPRGAVPAQVLWCESPGRGDAWGGSDEGRGVIVPVADRMIRRPCGGTAQPPWRRCRFEVAAQSGVRTMNQDKKHQSSTKPLVTPKPETKPDAKPDARPEAKPGHKPEIKVEPKTKPGTPTPAHKPATPAKH